MNQTTENPKSRKKKKGFAVLGLILLIAAIAALAYWQFAAESYRAQFTTRIVDKEPVDKIVAVKKIRDGRITFFSEITNQKGKAIAHVWKNGDKVVYTHRFSVSSDKWRANSDVSQGHFNKGDKATVEIQDKEGKVLGSYTIKVE